MPDKNMTLGRCHKCNQAFYWAGHAQLGVVVCPSCGGPLQQTTRQWSGGFTLLDKDYINTCKAKARPTPEQLEQAFAYVRAYSRYFSDRGIDLWQTRKREFAKLEKLCPYTPQMVMALKQARAIVKKENATP